LRGKTLAAAKRALAARRCRLGAVSRTPSSLRLKGRVISQRPATGKRVTAGTRVRVTLGRGPRR